MGEIWESVWNNTVVCVAQLFFGFRAITEIERNLVAAALEHQGVKDSIRNGFTEIATPSERGQEEGKNDARD